MAATPAETGSEGVDVTHPFHSLHGQEFEVVDRRRVKSGEERLYLQVGPEQLVTVPASWTTLGPPSPLRPGYLVAAPDACATRLPEGSVPCP